MRGRLGSVRATASSSGWRRWPAAVFAVVVVTVGAALPARAEPVRDVARLPDRYVVSRDAGVLPEGIGLGPHGAFFVTSSATGAIYRGRLNQRRMTLFAPAGSAGRTSALGVHTDRAGRVFVAGSTALDVYSPTGRLLAHRTAPAGSVGRASLNDLVVTDDAVYVTDFANPVILRASLRGNSVGVLRPWVDVAAAEPGLPAPYWFLNGIVVSPDQRTLLVSSQGLEQVLRVGVRSRRTSVVDLGPAPFAADGMELHGHTLYGVLNYDAPAGQGVYVAALDPGLRTGRVVGAITDRFAPFDSPTALARDGHGRLLVVNSQLDHAPGTPPYTVAAVREEAGRPVASLDPVGDLARRGQSTRHP